MALLSGAYCQIKQNPPVFRKGAVLVHELVLAAKLEHRHRITVHQGDRGGSVMATVKSSRVNYQYKTKPTGSSLV